MIQEVDSRLSREHPLDRGEKVLKIERLGQIVIRAELDALDRNCQVINGRQHDDAGLDIFLLERLENGDAVHARHPDIQQNQILWGFRQDLHGDVPIIGYLNFVALARQLTFDEETERFFVVDVEDFLRRFGTGHVVFSDV